MRAVLLLATVLALPVAAQSVPAAHQAALDAWQSEWGSQATLAPASDFAFIDSYRQQQPDVHPYYVAGDFNRDGYGDFAALVVGPLQGEGEEAYREAYVLVFNGQGGGQFEMVHQGAVDSSYSEPDAYRGIMMDTDDEGYLMAFLAETDAGAEIFVPFRGGYAIYQEEGI